jgi:type II secretory pathway component PulF
MADMNDPIIMLMIGLMIGALYGAWAMWKMSK